MMLGLLVAVKRVKVDLKFVIKDIGPQFAAIHMWILSSHQQYVINLDMSLIVVSENIQHKFSVKLMSFLMHLQYYFIKLQL